MAAGYPTTLRDAKLLVLANAINAGAGAGKIRIYTGSRPATGGAVTTLLAELTFSDPAHSGIASGILTFAAVTSDASADNTGTAVWARILDSTNAFVADISVGAGSGDLNLNTTSIVAGGTVSINTGGTVTDGNP